MAGKSGAGRDGREDEGGCLENNCGSNVTGGSNPSPSAFISRRENMGRSHSLVECARLLSG